MTTPSILNFILPPVVKVIYPFVGWNQSLISHYRACVVKWVVRIGVQVEVWWDWLRLLHFIQWKGLETEKWELAYVYYRLMRQLTVLSSRISMCGTQELWSCTFTLANWIFSFPYPSFLFPTPAHMEQSMEQKKLWEKREEWYAVGTTSEQRDLWEVEGDKSVERHSILSHSLIELTLIWLVKYKKIPIPFLLPIKASLFPLFISFTS